jgi:hypothetical protein
MAEFTRRFRHRRRGLQRAVGECSQDAKHGTNGGAAIGRSLAPPGRRDGAMGPKLDVAPSVLDGRSRPFERPAIALAPLAGQSDHGRGTG